MPEQTQEPARPFGFSALVRGPSVVMRYTDFCQHDNSHGAPSSPIEHAFPVRCAIPSIFYSTDTLQDQYQFALRSVGAGTPQRSIPIDPALLSLPGGADADLKHPLTVAQTSGLKAAAKVAGSRRNGKERADPKGKKRKHVSSDSEDDGKAVRKRGRPTGSGT